MNDVMDVKVYLNGNYSPLSEAKVSVLDRGFLFGDGVYEVVPCYRGRLFRMQSHIDRLHASLAKIRLDFESDLAYWQNIIEPLIDSTIDQSVYIQITRGVSNKRDHAFPAEVKPTVFVMCSEIKPFAGTLTGVKALTVEDSRWDMCDVKATTLLANVLLRQSAVEQGCAEAILHKNGYVTEGAASNIFAVIDDVLFTPEKNADILPGITREVVLELAEQNGIEHREEIISVDALQNASEIWMTSSTREIVPIVMLDDEPVGEGVPGPLWQRMNQLYQEYKNQS
jgi:D-alanine transaminase